MEYIKNGFEVAFIKYFLIQNSLCYMWNRGAGQKFFCQKDPPPPPGVGGGGIFRGTPLIEGLKIPDVLSFARENQEINLHMPEYECEKYPSTKWIWSVCMAIKLLIINS